MGIFGNLFGKKASQQMNTGSDNNPEPNLDNRTETNAEGIVANSNESIDTNLSEEEKHKNNIERCRELAGEIFKHYAACEGIQLEGFPDVKEEKAWPQFLKKLSEYLNKLCYGKYKNKILYAEAVKEILEQVNKMGDVSLRFMGDDYINAYAKFHEQQTGELWFMRLGFT